MFVNTSPDRNYVVYSTWENWYYGYTTYMPEKITVENLTLAKPGTVYLIGPCGTEASADPNAKVGTEQKPNKNPMVPIKEAVVINPGTSTYYVSDKPWLCDRVEIKNSED